MLSWSGPSLWQTGEKTPSTPKAILYHTRNWWFFSLWRLSWKHLLVCIQYCIMHIKKNTISIKTFYCYLLNCKCSIHNIYIIKHSYSCLYTFHNWINSFSNAKVLQWLKQLIHNSRHTELRDEVHTVLKGFSKTHPMCLYACTTGMYS